MGILVVFFRLANFAALVGAGIYVYIYYIKSFIQDAMQKEEQIVVGLQKEHDQVVATHALFKDRVVQQQAEYMRIQSHIAIWNQAIEEEDRECSQKKDRVIAQIKEKNQYKKQELYKSRLAARVIPRAVDAAEKNLKQIFVDDVDSEKTGTRFLQSIITSLKEY